MFAAGLVGHNFTFEPVSVVFPPSPPARSPMSSARLLGVAARARRPNLIAYGLLLLGLLASVATDAFVSGGAELPASAATLLHGRGRAT